MVKKTKVFKPGDYVFAKVKGYPAWPAKVNDLNGKKYNIYFYGTGETGNLPANDLFDYFDNKKQFLAKAIKRRDYNDGLAQIEEEITSVSATSNANISGEALQNVSQDEADTTIEDASKNESTLNDEQNITAETDKTADEEEDDHMEVDEPTHPQTGDSVLSSVEEQQENESASVEPASEIPQEEVAEAVKTPKPRGRKPGSGKTPKTPKSQSPKKSLKSEPVTPKQDTPSVDSTTSRSGRKIKPKRYLDEENDEAPPGKKSKLMDHSPVEPVTEAANGKVEGKLQEVVTVKKRKKSILQNGDGTKESSDGFNFVSTSDLQDGTATSKLIEDAGDQRENILLCVLPNGKIVGLKLYQNRPQTFGSPEAQTIWENNMTKNSLKLKSQLESGEITPDSILAQIATTLNLTDEEITAVKKERETEIRKDNLNFFRTENRLVDLEIRIRTALSYNDPEVTLCIELLAQMAELEMKPIMLVKHPSVLEAVKRIRKYTGNLKQWNLSKEEEMEFDKKAHILRKKAEHCYNMFRTLFTVTEGHSFLETFSNFVLRFKEHTKDFTEQDLTEVTEMPPELESQPSALTMKSSVEELEKSDKTVKEKPAAKSSVKEAKVSKADKK